MSLVFINYRRRGEAYAAALLDDRLSAEFGATAVFRASRSISAGADYEMAILDAIGQCHAMLAMIGPDWTEAFNRSPCSPRDDWVRREIAEALKREIPVVPVLLSGADRLAEEDVPPDIAQLARAQYLRFDYRNLEQDASRIVMELRRIAPQLPSHQTNRLFRWSRGR